MDILDFYSVSRIKDLRPLASGSGQAQLRSSAFTKESRIRASLFQWVGDRDFVVFAKDGGFWGRDDSRMCVITYLVSGRLPAIRTAVPVGVDSIGIRWSGEVLGGEIGNEAILREAGRVEVPEMARGLLAEE